MNKDSFSPVTCKNCSYSFSGNYCNNCGEKVYHDHDKSIPHFFEDAFHFITHFDGTLLKTLKTIFTRPGQLSMDYVQWKTEKIFQALILFFAAGRIVPAVPIVCGVEYATKILSRLLGRFATNWMEQKMTSRHLTTEELAEVFAHKSEKWSKVMLLAIIPLAAAVQWLLHVRKRKYFFDHLMLSTEINSFYLVFVFIIWAAIVVLLHSLFKLPAFLFGDRGPLILASYFFFGYFVYRAFHRFYNEKKWIAFVKTLVFIALHVFIIIRLYKFLLFVAVMLSL